MLALASVWVLDAARVVGGLVLAWGALANSCELAWHPKNHHLDFPQSSEYQLASNWVFDRFNGIPFCELPKESYLIGSRTKFLEQRHRPSSCWAPTVACHSFSSPPGAVPRPCERRSFFSREAIACGTGEPIESRLPLRDTAFLRQHQEFQIETC